MSQSNTATIVTDISLDGAAQGEYAITDIYAAAYLHALNFKLKRARSDGYKTEFFFGDVPAKTIAEYYQGVSVAMSARKLYDSFQNMRRISRQVRLIPRETNDPMDVPVNQDEDE